MNGGAEVLVIYDKQCPACDYYCNMVRIRESVGEHGDAGGNQQNQIE
jgi:hypothetical protein